MFGSFRGLLDDYRLRSSRPLADGEFRCKLAGSISADDRVRAINELRLRFTDFNAFLAVSTSVTPVQQRYLGRVVVIHAT